MIKAAPEPLVEVVPTEVEVVPTEVVTEAALVEAPATPEETEAASLDVEAVPGACRAGSGNRSLCLTTLLPPWMMDVGLVGSFTYVQNVHCSPLIGCSFPGSGSCCALVTESSVAYLRML